MDFEFNSFFDLAINTLTETENRVLEAIGFYVEGEAKLRCPVDTGNLRSSLDHKIDGKEIIVGTNVEYAIYVEKGTRRMRAQPYLTPAIENNINNIKAIAEREFESL